MLSDSKVHVRFKLSALWATVMLCYIYGDIFGFFQQRTLVEIISGKSGPISTQGGLLVILATMPGSWMFYKLLGAVEAILTLTIVWYAYRWPKPG